jgi:hypothetical protein
MDGSITFVCTGDRAYDGQDGFSRLPGKWECGSTALVSGFRRFGQPVDSWGKESPADRGIREELILNGDGSWEWRYSATSNVYGGAVRTSVLLDPATGEILRASRTDPLGDTTYGISYSEQFPPIAVP